MSLHRFFLTEPLAGSDGASALPLSDADRHHLANALRIEAGDEIVVVEPDRTAWRVELTAVGPEHVTGAPVERIAPAWEPHVTLVQGVMKGARMDTLVEKAVEIGVEAIVPVVTERCVVRLEPAKRLERGERWRRVAHAAAKQSQRAFVPPVSDPDDLDAVAGEFGDYGVVLVLWEESSADGIGAQLDAAGARADSRVAIVIGPEGGLSDVEVAMLERNGARVTSLGKNILRSETAGIVASALCVYELSGLGGRPRG